MNTVYEKLLAVQESDARILRIEARLSEGPRRLDAAGKELDERRKKHAELSHRAKEAGRLADRKNAELEEVDRKIKNLGLKQNMARSNKEYEAFKHEIAVLRADFEVLEEEALQQWSIGEAREKEAAAEEARIATLEEELESARAAWEEEARADEEELGRLRSRREDQVADVPLNWMDAYDRVLTNRGVPVIVEVKEGYCGGCQMSVSIHDLTRTLKADQIVQCKACHRILFAETL